MAQEVVFVQGNNRTDALVKRLLREYVSRHLSKIMVAVVCMIAAAAMTAVNAWMLQPVLDEIFFKQDRQMLTLLPAAIMVVALINGVATYGHTMIMRQVGQRIIADMQLKLFSHLMNADLGLFSDQAAGRLISRFTNDIQLMRNAVSNVLTGIAKELLTMVFLIGVMFYQSIELTMIAFIIFPLAIFPVIRLGRRMRKISDSTQAQIGLFAAQLDETFQGVRVVKAYGQEQYEVERARSTIERLFQLYVKSSRVQAAASPIIESLAAVGIAAVIWYGGVHVLDGQTTPGAFFSFIAAMIMAYRPAKMLASLNTNLQEGLAAANRLFNVLDTKPQIADKPHAAPLHITQGSILFDHATFRYTPDGGGITDMNLTIPAGKTVALVGPSGGGKSTIMNLILRFYDLEQGRIAIDGQDIRDVTLASLRASMSLVTQETILFDDTVRANICYGTPEATEDHIIQAAKDASADEFIRQLPQGYDTLIGPRGAKLSGGQRQRIAIARAMLKNAPILLLDEATSSLDTTSERAVQQALQRLMHNRTTLVIAHRLSTVIDADLIYVIERGRMVEQGTHSSLLIQNGTYARLYADKFESGEEVFG